jgi:thiamine-monophosphate kinase
MQNNQKTPISAIGEFGLIKRLSKIIAIKNPETSKGIGDDAAVITPPAGEELLVSTDILAEGVHFDLSFTPLRHLGYKAVVVNISDIAAMNGICKQITVGIALDSRFTVEAVEEIYEGIAIACADYGVDLVGGDTTSSRKGLFISVTALGFAPKDKIVYRSGAKKGDILCVTGDLGAAYIGLQFLEREKQVLAGNPEAALKLEGFQYMIGRQLKPAARTDIVFDLRELGVVPTAMIDISDGLASEILHLCEESDAGTVVFEEHIPQDSHSHDSAVTELNLSPLNCALNGGEDYELLFTIRQEDFEKLKKHPDIHFIGYMKEKSEGQKLVLKVGQVLDLKAQGWVHFEK